ncbi:N-acetylmuramidase [Solitalea longa]|uniref:Peptidoglycan hydrolase n=1 Tax=Solitalea longa TaxID=2079460 RepID=A0A2S4ZZ55_9SPHI|nr:glucosaminidase domain-containing protein [Solitalea longa]POY35610.1 N-acetylmuramidase [Solitalea longa]
MNKFYLATLLLFINFYVSAQNNPEKLYAEKYGEMAVSEMKKTGIPASITLAQAIMECGAGKSKLAKQANNHFGVKAGRSWQGERFGNFRKYESVEAAYLDRSNFLTGRKNYASLFKLDPCDYKGWAKGLQRSGYAASKRYASDLIKCIQRNQLYNWDGEICKEQPVILVSDSLSAITASIVDEPENQPVVSEIKPVYHKVKKGESLSTVAKKYKTTVSKLKSLNSLHSVKIKPGQRLRVK